MNPTQLDQAYSDFITDLPRWIPEGISEVDLSLLEKTGLLHFETFEDKEGIDQLPHYFHVIETSEKVTLFNHQFVIWIVPKLIDEIPTTIVLIGRINGDKPHLEIVFSTKGVYNTPKLILKLLKHYISDVFDTEQAISSMEEKGS
ncbi:MAG: hypothetical protein HYZ47_00975 [Simkania negevensis]|nr:hypothetical protein [Simkania negevensis]